MLFYSIAGFAVSPSGPAGAALLMQHETSHHACSIDELTPQTVLCMFLQVQAQSACSSGLQQSHRLLAEAVLC
jgi:hypothetical protein